MTRLNFNLLLLIVSLLVIDEVLCKLTEKEMDDLENDMAIGMRKFKKSKEEEEYIRERLCARNLKAKEWENLSKYCFEFALNGNKCDKCKEVFVKSYEICNKKVKQTDGCNEITFNKRGACQFEVFEQNREEFLQAYKDHKDEFISLITKINECYKKIIDDNKWDMV